MKATIYGHVFLKEIPIEKQFDVEIDFHAQLKSPLQWQVIIEASFMGYKKRFGRLVTQDFMNELNELRAENNYTKSVLENLFASQFPYLDEDEEIFNWCAEIAEESKEEEIDLMDPDNYHLLPIEVKEILENIEDDCRTYEKCAEIIEKLEAHGYTADYGLDAEIYDLKKI